LHDYPADVLKTTYLFGDMHKGRPYEINSPNHALTRICKAQGLQHIRVHDLRHTYGSVVLSRKVPLELVSERLGHSSITITLNVYRHLLEEERQGHVFDVEALLSTPAPRGEA
jgi:integrase